MKNAIPPRQGALQHFYNGSVCLCVCVRVYVHTYVHAHIHTVQYSTVQYSTVQYSTVQYSTVQYSTIQYSTVQYSTLQYIAYMQPAPSRPCIPGAKQSRTPEKVSNLRRFKDAHVRQGVGRRIVATVSKHEFSK